MRFLWCAVTGLMFGSFANVYFHRIPLSLSPIQPRSFCPACRHPIPWMDNIPVLSFLLLRGKCRFCPSRISWSYPLVEAGCSVLFMIAAFKFRGEPLPHLCAFLLFSFLLFLIAGIDLVTFFQSEKEYGIIPDHLIWIMAASGLAFAPFNAVVSQKLWQGLAGGLTGGAVMLLFRWLGEKIFRKESLGLGDVKMVSAVGFWLGVRGVVFTLMSGSAVGSCLSLFFIMTKKMTRHSAIPFGPFLSLGAFAALLAL